jgi:hypothetical protein
MLCLFRGIAFLLAYDNTILWWFIPLVLTIKCVCVCVCVYAYVCVCAYIICVCVFMYARIYIFSQYTFKHNQSNFLNLFIQQVVAWHKPSSGLHSFNKKAVYCEKYT